jgi:hypothetical protein
MARMKRKQLYIDADHDEKVKRIAESGGVTESDVIRAAIDALPAPAIAGTRIVHRDPAAWAQARAFIKALARRPSRPGASSTPAWTRDQLYDERVGRARR